MAKTSKRTQWCLGSAGLAILATVAGCRSLGSTPSDASNGPRSADAVRADAVRAGTKNLSATGAKSSGDAEPVTVTSKVHVAYIKIHDDAYRLAQAKKFAEIETKATAYRKSQAKFLDGHYELAAFYVGLSEVGDASSDAQWEDRRRIIEGWVKRDPRSITARVALARCYYYGASRARGSAWAREVKEEQWKVVHERLEKSAQALEDSSSMRRQCPGWFAAAQRVAFLAGTPANEFDALTDEGLRLFPDYDDFHFMRAKHRMERWYGEKGDWQRYAAQVAKAAGGDAGDVLYARIVWYMENYVTDETPLELVGIDWPRAKRGFDLLMKEPDSLGAAGAYARAAWLTGDRETAKILFEKFIGNNRDYKVWLDEAEFKDAREWALGK